MSQPGAVGGPSLPPRGPDPVQAPPPGFVPPEVTTATRSSATYLVPRPLGRPTTKEPPVPRTLSPVAWARVMFVVASLASVVFAVTAGAAASGADSEEMTSPERIAGAGVLVAMLLVLVGVLAWSVVNVVNARRVLDASRHRNGVSGWRAAFWWLSYGVVGIPLALAVAWVERRFFDDHSYGSDDWVFRGMLGTVTFVIALLLWASPYLYLGGVMRKLRGDRSLFHRWCWLPVVAIVGTYLGLIWWSGFFVDERVPRAVRAAVAAFALALPCLVWCWSGWTALRSMDVTVRDRSTRLHLERERWSSRETNRVTTG